MDFSPIQIAIVLVIALLVFGPKRVPELGKSLGQGLRSFKDSITGNDEEKPELEATNRPADAEPVSRTA